MPPELAWVEPLSRLGVVGLLFAFIGALYVGKLRLAREVEQSEKERVKEREASEKALKDNDEQWRQQYNDRDALWRERYSEVARERDEWKALSQKPLALLEPGIHATERLVTLLEAEKTQPAPKRR